MQFRALGKQGPQVSLAGLGCSNFGLRIDDDASKAVLHKALDLGITFLDTADSYGENSSAEECLGGLLGAHRKDVVLATKYGFRIAPPGSRAAGTDRDARNPGTSRRYTMSAIEASLRRLRTDWIDLYQIHVHDPETPIEETLRALDDLVRQGKIRHYGCSGFSAAQIGEAMQTAQRHGLRGFVSLQQPYSLLDRKAEREVIPAMEKYGMGLIPNVPLHMGLLSGKYRRDAAPPAQSRLGPRFSYTARFFDGADWPTVEALREFGAARGRSMVEMALGWLAGQSPVASIITGATSPEQVAQNFTAIETRLEPAELAELDRLTRKA